MDKDLYRIMKDLMEQKGTDSSDVIYLGTIFIEEEGQNRKCKNCKRYNCND